MKELLQEQFGQFGRKPHDLALPSVSTVKPLCNKRITLTHTANMLFKQGKMKNKHSGLFMESTDTKLSQK